MTVNLDVARLLVGGVLLLLASFTDLRTRRVPNALWLEGFAFGLVLLVWDGFVYRGIGWIDLAFVFLIPVIAYALWRGHLLAGGADAKALMTLAVLLPAPLHLAPGWPTWTSPFPPTLVVLLNALLLMLAAPLYFFLLNLARGNVALPRMLLGYRLHLDEAARRPVWIMERVGPEGRIRPFYFPSRSSPEQEDANVRALEEKGVRHVWVTPKIPFMVPLALGFFAAFILGDPLNHLILLALR